MRNLAKFFIDNYKFTFVLSFGVMIFGIGGLMRLNSESYPAVNFAMATVNTAYDGASAEEVETQITKPIEDEIRTVSGIKDVRSVSQAGLSSIFIRADLDNINVREVMSDLQKAIDSVTDLPQDLRDPPKFTEIKSEEFPAIEIAVIGSNDSRARDIVADLLKEDIEDNKKVLNVRTVGLTDRTFRIELIPNKLKQFHVGIDEIIEKIQLRNVNVPGGKVEKSGSQSLIRIESKIHSVEELENTIIRSNFSGQTIFLKDVASVLDDASDSKVFANHNGEDATLLIVNKKAGADTIELVHDIDKKIAHFTDTYQGRFEFVVYNNEANKVKSKLSILSSNAFWGLVLVMFFLLVFLPGRIGLVASISLPLAVLATIGFVPPLDMNLNAVTILAMVIALGMLVDNSVVISENYARLRQEGLLPMEAANKSIEQLWLPISATVMTTIAAFLPMLVTKGIMGQFIKFIPIIVSISLVVSLVESFFLLPMRLVKTDSPDAIKKVSTKETSDWFTSFSKKFERFMHFAVDRRYFMAAIYIGLILLSGVMMVVFNKFILFPATQTEIYTARLELKPGVTLDDTNRVIEEISRQALTYAGSHIDHIVGRAGTSQMGPADPKGKDGDSTGIIFFYVNEDTKFNVSDDVVLAKLRKIAPTEIMKELTFAAVVNGPPVGEPLNATFRSNDTASLKAAVYKIKNLLEDKKGITNVSVDDVYGDNEIFVDLDFKKVDQLGLNAKSIGNAIRSAVSGKRVSSVNLRNKEVDIRLRFNKLGRTNLDEIKSIEIMDRRGNLIPLSSIAKFRKEGGGLKIKRFDFKRSKTITADVDKNFTTPILANKFLLDSFEEIRPDHPDVSMIFGGEGESTKESMESLGSALILSLIGIFALLVFMFNSFSKPFIIMTTIPLGLIGFSVAFALHKEPISFLAMIGIIGLGGIIVNSGIILISFIDEMRQTGQLTLQEALASASRIRLRAVLVSSLTTISGLFPTAYGIGGSDSFLMPMTLSMAWGLTSGTILTLVWIPCAYAINEDISNKFRSFCSRFKPNDVSRNQVGDQQVQKGA